MEAESWVKAVRTSPSLAVGYLIILCQSVSLFLCDWAAKAGEILRGCKVVREYGTKGMANVDDL